MNRPVSFSEIINLYITTHAGLGDGSILADDCWLGACSEITRCVNLLAGEGIYIEGRTEIPSYIREVISHSWRHYSGYPDYPVPDPEGIKSASMIFQNTQNLWTGEYGKLRRAYCTYVAEELRKVTAHDIFKHLYDSSL